ncbi:MAG: 1-hydroxy-2-methyl-2-(E)-butenyl 4-diphosphate synthase [Deltaproteobacteria bacterium]|jgi:(E)-4-hydroxy-3-methylbut-2-enyl-diphosphate synthase|nr:1-hydroxy-2-methyl-2-(E)-butenyl 4-diphosphate synthase [Deltaproteobacteria bacterium]
MIIPRRKTHQICIGPVQIGGNAPISVQSMTKTDTRDIGKTVRQIRLLEEAGCEIIRVAIVDEEAARAVAEIKKKIRIPLVADIHFHSHLALRAIESGADGLRINPGNIGGRDRLKPIVTSARNRSVPIRIGVNSGSLEKDLLKRFGGASPEAMVSSALRTIEWMEDLGFHLIKISLKASDVLRTVEAYRLFSKRSDYPLHLGVTEAGKGAAAIVKSSLGIGLLLSEGIGDTLRVSLTGDPAEEVRVGYGILRALDIRKRGVEIISCPTCGRCEIHLAPLVAKVEQGVKKIDAPLTVAMMGCVVNGPGEAKEADIGIAGGKGVGVLFKKGKVVRKLKEKDFVSVLLNEIQKMVQER